jgi:hypothetical protein
MGETAISKDIRDALKKAGWRVERVNAGMVKVAGGFMHLASKGTPDSLVMGLQNAACGCPIFGWLETKTAIGKLNEHQIKWHAWARSVGINVDVVRSKEDALEAVGKWKN